MLINVFLLILNSNNITIIWYGIKYGSRELWSSNQINRSRTTSSLHYLYLYHIIKIPHSLFLYLLLLFFSFFWLIINLDQLPPFPPTFSFSLDILLLSHLFWPTTFTKSKTIYQALIEKTKKINILDKF